MIKLYKSGLVTDYPVPLMQFQTQFSASISRVSHLRRPFTTVGYQVTPGKTLYIVKIANQEKSFGNVAYYKLGYCDNDVGWDSALAPTNPVMSVGLDDTNDNGLTLPAFPSNGDGGREYQTMTCFIKMAIGGKFPFVRRYNSAVAGKTVLLWGIEL